MVLADSGDGSRPGMDKLPNTFLLLLGSPSLTRPIEALFQPPDVLIEEQQCGGGGRAVIGHVWLETFSMASCAAPAAALCQDEMNWPDCSRIPLMNIHAEKRAVSRQ